MLSGFFRQGQKAVTGAVKIGTLATLAIILLAGSFAVSVILTAIVRKAASRLGFAAHPAADRYHRSVVPLGGGIAIFATITSIMVTGVFAIKVLLAPGYFEWVSNLANIDPADFLGKLNELIVILVCLSILFILGLWDDKKHIGPFTKLIVEFAVAVTAAVFGDVRVEFFIESKVITALLSAVWIVLIINVFNFLDNMDGAAAGIAVIVTSILLTAAVVDKQVFVGGLAVIFVGTLLGFLVFNFPPAKIFMGDAGSLVVGFVLALLTLRTTYYNQALSGQWYPVFMPLVVMAVPLYDFVSVSLLRISQGKSPFVGDTQHFSHRLRRQGLTDTQTVLTLYLATLCTGLGATFLYQVNLAGAILILIQTVMVLSVIAIFETAAANDNSST